MRLRKPCQHGRYDVHVIPWVRGDRKSGDPGIYDDCPGGEFLADDALVIEKVDGTPPKWVYEVLAKYPDMYELDPKQVEALKSLGLSVWDTPKSHVVASVLRELEAHFTDDVEGEE